MEYLFNLIFPQRCKFCNKFGIAVCLKCLSSTKLLLDTTCISCDKPSINGSTHNNCRLLYFPNEVLYIYEYKGITQEIIQKSKYKNKEFSLLKCLTRYGIQIIKHLGYGFNKDKIVIPIPISSKRMQQRGFNQAEIIAHEIASEFDLKICKNVLFRKKDTKPQYGNSRRERFENIANAFELKNQNLIKKREILLVDDISTSGATVLEACKALYTAEILRIDVFILAKKLLRKHQSL